MNEKVLASIAERISRITGVQLGEKQKTMVVSRLQRRCRELNLENIEAYQDYLNKNEDKEMPHLISLLTTHHTFFFREFVHFEFIEEKLPELVESLKAQGRKELKVWSAACSHGQEVYSLTMLLLDRLSKIAPDIKLEVYGSDVDEKAVEFSRRGIYRWQEAKEIPTFYLNKYWLKGTGEIADFVKAKPVMTRHCRFKTVNLMEVSKEPREKFDIIFCRNVFIYFTEEDIKKITSEFTKRIEDHGYIVTGLSESIAGLGLDIEHLGRSIYGSTRRKVVDAPAPTPAAPDVAAATAAPAPRKVIPIKKGPLRVIVVDDSPTVQKLMQKMLTKENGFEIVATAMNGVEAAEKLKTANADVMTLDIHMPELNGIDYLKRHFNNGHPPVVMVSSVSMEEGDLAYSALKLGAFDYVQKPDLKNFAVCRDQLTAKLRYAHRSSLEETQPIANVATKFEKAPLVLDTENKLRLVFCAAGDRDKMEHIFKELKSPQPPTIALLDSPPNLVAPLAKELDPSCKLTVKPLEEGADWLAMNHIYIAQIGQLDSIMQKYGEYQIVNMVLGEPESSVEKAILAQKDGAVIFEDSGKEFSALYKKASEIVPYTSFAYESDCLFSGVKKAA